MGFVICKVLIFKHSDWHVQYIREYVCYTWCCTLNVNKKKSLSKTVQSAVLPKGYEVETKLEKIECFDISK